MSHPTLMLGILGDPMAADEARDRARAHNLRLKNNPFTHPRALSTQAGDADLEIMQEICQTFIGAENPGLLDQMSRGGSIPFDSLSLGLSTHANDRYLVEDWLSNGIKPDPSSDIERVPLPELPNRIRAKRQEWGMTRKELAEYLGINKWSIFNWEVRAYKPSRRNYRLLCQWLAQDITSRTRQTDQ